jgi:amino acid transporter
MAFARTPLAPPSASSLRVAAQVQAHSSILRKELGLRDLVLAQILYMLIPEFFGTAAKAGSAEAALWLFAIVLFFIPLAMVVTRLNRLMPLEGGLYEWARLAFGDRIGFLTAWNLWLYGVIYMSMAGLITTRFVAYAMGERATWLINSKLTVVLASVSLTTVIMLVTSAGFSVSKWVANVGGAVTILALAALVLMPWLRHDGARWSSEMTMPSADVFTLSVFSKMTFGALCGFEYVAIFAGECRNPEKNLPRSVVISAPFIVLFYILGTRAILPVVPAGAVDVTAAIPQALSRGFHSFGIAGAVLPLAVLCLLINYFGTFNVMFNGCARLPMTAGWDNLLPPWFTRLHARYRTPVNSIMFAGGISLVVSAAVLLGVKEEESFELLLIWAFAFYAVAYLVLFAIPLFARKDFGLAAGLGLRIAAISGLLMTALYILLSVFPIIDVQGPWEYAVKTAGVVLGANFLGAALYMAGRKSRNAAPEGAASERI